MNYKICDTHTHIYFEDYDTDRENILHQIENELEFIVSISCDLESALKSLNLAKKYKNIYSTIGYHPVDISKFNKDDYNKMLNLAITEKKIIAVGEIGLDYHWMKDPKDIQKKFFKMQIEDAININLPVVIHTREALEDTLNILKEYKKLKGILHCYPGSFESYKPLIDNFYIGIGGVLTFKNNIKTKELVKNAPIEKIVIETDSPYLTPVPFRGKRNSPLYTKYVAQEIANIKNMHIQDVINITTKNAYDIYNIK